MLLLLLHDGRYDRVYQGAALAAAACENGEDVTVVWFFWALERLLDGRLDVIDIAELESPRAPQVAENFERFQQVRVSELLAMARDSGRLTTFACSASAKLLEFPAERVLTEVDEIVGWPTVAAMMKRAEHVLWF